MTHIPRFAVIATRNRPKELRTCLDSIKDQVDDIIIINNNDAYSDGDHSVYAMKDRAYPDLTVLPMRTQPPNLSRMWNKGLGYARRCANRDTHDVAILNDDAIVPPGWFEAMGTAMREYGAAAASQPPFGSERLDVFDGTGVPGVHNRVTGWAFLLRAEKKPRFDERFQWWCGDDDISMWARNNGGLIHVPGYPVENTHANQSTKGLLLEISAGDMQRFVDKWGMRPW